MDPAPCGTFPYGEVEDYTVVISNSLVGGDPRQTGADGGGGLPNFSLFPNPVGEQLTLDLLDWLDRPVTLELYNTLGVLVEKWAFEKIPDAPISLDFGKIQNGHYQLRCVSPGFRPVAKVVAVGRDY